MSAKISGVTRAYDWFKMRFNKIYFLTQTPFIEAKCPRNDCFATNNRSYMAHEDFDAILFHQRPMDHNDIPQNRSQFLKSKTSFGPVSYAKC